MFCLPTWDPSDSDLAQKRLCILPLRELPSWGDLGLGLVLGPDFCSGLNSLKDFCKMGPPISGTGVIFHTCPDIWKLWVWPQKEGVSGLSPEVVKSLFNARAPSMRSVYALNWWLVQYWNSCWCTSLMV